jgi:hypothetical protein
MTKENKISQKPMGFQKIIAGCITQMLPLHGGYNSNFDCALVDFDIQRIRQS